MNYYLKKDVRLSLKGKNGLNCFVVGTLDKAVIVRDKYDSIREIDYKDITNVRECTRCGGQID